MSSMGLWSLKSSIQRCMNHNPDSVLNLTKAQAHGEPFVVPTPTNRHILVSSEQDVKELSEAPVDQLSLHAVAKEVDPCQNSVFVHQ